MRKIFLFMAFFSLTLMSLGQDSKIVISDYPLEVKIDCLALNEVSLIEATSLCEGKVNVVFKDVPASGGCAGTLIRNWTATDACGNTTSGEQFLKLNDVSDPVMSQIEDVTVGNVDHIVLPTAIDDCTVDVKVTYSDVRENVGEEVIITRTYTATDDCGKKTMAIQKIKLGAL